MPSEISQVKTFKYGMMSLMCVDSRNTQMNQMEETHRYREQSSGSREEGSQREGQMGKEGQLFVMVTMLCIQKLKYVVRIKHVFSDSIIYILFWTDYYKILSTVPWAIQ